MDRRDQSERNIGVWLAAGVGACLAARAAVRRQRRMDLAGKAVLITGGSRGLGLVMAREFIARGAKVAICARDAADLDQAEAELRGRGGEVVGVTCDVTQRDAVERTVRRVEQHFGRIDVLVNNAGIIMTGPLETMTLEDYVEAMRTHFWGPLYATMAVLPGMKRRGEGRIVNISSIGGKVPAPHLAPYVASKFALTGLSESLRTELIKDGIYVTTIEPGLMRTGSPRNAFFKGQHRKEYALFKLADSLPGTSISARRAARRIVTACQRGESEVILSLSANLAARFHGLFPGASTELYSLLARVLPGPGGIDTRRVRGRDSESAVSRSFLTALTDRAALENNEVRR